MRRASSEVQADSSLVDSEIIITINNPRYSHRVSHLVYVLTMTEPIYNIDLLRRTDPSSNFPQHCSRVSRHIHLTYAPQLPVAFSHWQAGLVTRNSEERHLMVPRLPPHASNWLLYLETSSSQRKIAGQTLNAGLTSLPKSLSEQSRHHLRKLTSRADQLMLLILAFRVLLRLLELAFSSRY